MKEFILVLFNFIDLLLYDLFVLYAFFLLLLLFCTLLTIYLLVMMAGHLT